jgi:hypothetical protein
VTTTGTVMTVATGWALVTTNVTTAVPAQPLQIAIAVSIMPTTKWEHVYATTDTEVKAVHSG